MSGTAAGALKTVKVNLSKNPNFYRDIGAKGGAVKTAKGFAVSGQASSAGRKGGKISRRGKAKGLGENDIEYLSVELEPKKGWKFW
jgi:general stress protein YciG